MAASPGSKLVITTDLGVITLTLRPDSAPVTCEYVSKCASASLYDGCGFYRSDFVIQCGLHGSGKTNPFGSIPVNETSSGTQISNSRGTAAIAHWDVPDNGNTEFFINLGANAHLDAAYGGYCVFACVETNDAASWSVIETIASAIASEGKTKVGITSICVA